MNNIKEKTVILGVLLIALYMRLHYMTRSFFYDELYTAIHGVQAPNLMDALFKDYSPSNHLGYTAIAYFTCHLLGTKEWTLRLPALLFGIGSIFIFWHWVRKYFGKETAILGAFLLAFIPAHIIWSASARGYSACIFFALLSTSLYFSLLEKPRLKTTLMLTLTNTFAASFQIYFLGIFLAQFLHFLLMSTLFCTKHETSIKLRSLFYFLLSMGSTILCSILLYCKTIPTLSAMAVGHREFVSDFPLTLLRDLLSLSFWPLGSFCLVLMFIGFMRSNKELPYWRVYVAVLFLMVLPVWLAKPVYLYPRFFAHLLPFFILLLANGTISIVKNSPNRVRPYIIILLMGVLSLIIWTWVFKPAKIVADFHYKFRESVQFAESAASPQTQLCAFGNEADFFQFYSHRPVMTFKTFEDFKTFYDRNSQIICLFMNGPPMPEEHKKIFLFTLSLTDVKAKNFDNIIVLDLKG